MSPLLKTLGAVASRTWLDTRGIPRPFDGWFIEVALRTELPDVRFELNVYPEEWGFVLRIGKRLSSIRVTDVAFVHGVDDLKLLGRTPSLEDLPDLLSAVQREHAVELDDPRPIVHTNLDEARVATAVQTWLSPAAASARPSRP